MEAESERKLFRKIYKEYESGIYFFCVTLLKTPADAESVASRVFRDACEAGLAQKGLPELKKLLYRSAVEKCREFYSEKEPQEYDAFKDFWEEDMHRFPERTQKQTFLDLTNSEILYEKIIALPFQLRSVILCFYWAGWNTADIAEAENVPEEIIQSRLWNAVNLLGGEEFLLQVRSALSQIHKTIRVPKHLIPQSRPDRYRILLWIAGCAVVLGLAAAATGIYFIASYQNSRNRYNIYDTMIAATASPTFKATLTPKPQPTDAAGPTPSGTPRAGERPVASKLIYDNDRYLIYEYDGNTVTAKDRYGNIILEYIYNAEGILLSEKRFTLQEGNAIGNGIHIIYDQTGRIQRKTEYNSASSIRYDEVYEYNESGLLVKITAQYTGYEDPSITTCEYDPNGTIRKQITKTHTGDEIVCLYNASGAKLKETSYRGSKLNYKHEYEYDEDGNLWKSKSVTFPATANNYIDSYVVYDKTGKAVESFTEYEGIYIGNFVTQYLYDENGQEIMRLHSDRYSNGIRSYDFKIAGYDVTLYETLYDQNGIPAPYLFGETDGEITAIRGGYEKEIGRQFDYTFDHNGNVLSRTFYDGNGDATYIQKCEYDYSGKKVREDHYEQSYNGMTLLLTCTYEYDAAGTLAKIKKGESEYIYQDGKMVRYVSGETLKIDFEYNKEGSLARKTVYFQESSISGVLSYQYDETGKQTLQACWFNDHILYFDASGRKVKDELCHFDGSIKTSTIYEYNADGYLTEQTESNAEGGLLAQTVIEYDAEFNKISTTKVTYDGNGVITSKTVQKENQDGMNESVAGMTFDQNGCLVKWNGTDSGGTQFKMEFQWIDEKDPAYLLYTLCRPSDLIP